LQIFNQHHSTVYDVTLADTWSEDFEIVNGLTKATWESIPGAGSVSHSYLVRPLKAGLTEFSRADVSYRYVSAFCLLCSILELKSMENWSLCNPRMKISTLKVGFRFIWAVKLI
jgi:hypothetical protein